MRCVLALVIACGGSPPAAKPKSCEAPAAGSAYTQEQCACAGGNVQLSIGGAVELHCEPGEAELGTAQIDARTGWCCKPR